MTQLNLSGRVAAITGGASGIGKAIAQSFAAAGAQVRIVDVDGPAAARTADEITSAGGNALAFQCDVTDGPDVESVFSRIASHNSIDVLVNCAGIAQIGTIADTETADFERVFCVNVKGTFLCMKAVLPGMINQGRGSIVNMASIAATAGLSKRFAYSMSKGAVLAMTLSVAKDFIDKNIRCNCISPARVHTPFVDGFLHASYPGREKEMFAELSHAQPIGRMATPEEVAVLALYLSSDSANFLTGANIPFDGGFTYLRN